MRFSLLVAALAAPLVPAIAAAAPTGDWSARIAAEGLGATATAIEALDAPTPEDRFALAAVRFLGGVEKALHARWLIGQGSETGFLPVFRVPVGPNPAPAPFDPAIVETTFAALSADMDRTREALAAIPTDAALSLDLRLEDLWFDVNGSQGRDPDEGALAIAAFLLASQPRFDPETGSFLPPPTPPASIPVSFDQADAAWLSAYTHLLSATSDLVRAFAPTGPIARVAEGRKAMVAAGVAGPLDTLVFGRPAGTAADFPNDIDAAAMALLALRQQPLPERTRAARDHFLAMIADNRRFWTLVAAETDNRQEWIPNAAQTAALGAAFPKGADVAWQAVLDDGEKLLRGDLLLPWIAPGAGFDLGAWLQDPGPVDLIEWLHGMGETPWLKQGPVVNQQSWRAFAALAAGDAMLFAVWLN